MLSILLSILSTLNMSSIISIITMRYYYNGNSNGIKRENTVH